MFFFFYIHDVLLFVPVRNI